MAASQSPPVGGMSTSHPGNLPTRSERIDALPDPVAKLPYVRLYSHSTLVYWWPVWAYGYLAAIITYIRGGVVRLDEVKNSSTIFYDSSALGIGFIVVLVLTILFTNVRLRGIYSLLVVLSLAFIVVLFAWLGWWDEIAAFIPQLSIKLNLGFYVVFSTLLFAIWIATFVIFDRLTFWIVRPGQMTVEHLIGSRERSYDTQGMLFEKEAEDLFRHKLLGLGAGDLTLTTTGARKETLRIPNVLFVDGKVRAIQKLVATKPDELMSDD